MLNHNSSNAKRIRLPVLQGVLPVSAAQLPGELIAGFTLAALAIPEVMGYTKIAGMPVITGLYTIVIPMALFAIFGSSRHLVVGADSATAAAILAAGLAGVAASGSPEYVALAGVLALMAAGCLLLARFLRLGFLADFLSRTVLTGFLTGVGIQVAIGQITGLLGIADGGSFSVLQLPNYWRQFAQINPYVLGLSATVLAVIVGTKLVSKRLPGALIAVVAAIVASWAFDLPSYGVPVLGAIPGGLPSLGLPKVNWSWQLFQQLMPCAFAMFVVILAQSAATSRAYAARHNENCSENLGPGRTGCGQPRCRAVRSLCGKWQPDQDSDGR